MFQRIKAAVDIRIAEEQARQKAAISPVARSPSTTRRSAAESPNKRTRRPRPEEDGTGTRPDPSEFETAFVIEDESEAPTRVGTPVSAQEKKMPMAENGISAGNSPLAGSEKNSEGEAIPGVSVDLPADVRTKLRKLEKLEARYQELLRSYRIAHTRAVSIEPFEKVLKENTPISSISDPDALVEYLNQLNLKGDMVMDELKRVSGDRDDYRKKFEESESQAAAAREELQSIKASAPVEGTATPSLEKADSASIDTPSASVKSPVQSVLGLFSPKQKPADSSEEFFSYDDEIPKLQSEVRAKSAEVENLKSKVSTLQNNLATAQETSSNLVQDLEKVTRELNESKEASSLSETRKEQLDAQNAEIQDLKNKLQTTEKQLADLESDLEKQKQATAKKVAAFEADLENQKASSGKELKSEADARKDAEQRSELLEVQIRELRESKAEDNKRIQELSRQLESSSQNGESLQVPDAAIATGASTPTSTSTPVGPAKKKNKKKKKGGAAAASKDVVSTPEIAENTPEQALEPTPAPEPTTSIATELQTEINRLRGELADKDQQIQKLQSKRKTEEELREELENMQDNLLTIGQEHVEAKDKIKELQAEKVALQEKVTKLESEIQVHQSKLKTSAKVEADLKSLTAEYEDLKLKSATLQTDLGAAQQLATSRYRDLTDLRDVLQKAQPELKSLRAENATLKTAKEELSARTSELRRFEAREKDLKGDLASFKKQASDRENEIRTLNEKIVQETNSRLRAEDQNRIAQRDMRKSEAEKIQISASAEKASQELAKVLEEVGRLRPRVKELEEQVSKLTTESKGLREEVELRGSQYNNAQGLLGSMRDQTAEMAMQLKEAKEQSDSLEEELGEVQRLLGERTREGETMRRLLADVDDRADAKVREMRERMDAAIEERDRAEDEASTNGRRRAREVDELKTKIRDFERDLKRITDDRDDLARSEKELKRKRDELEGVAEKSSQEVDDIRSAMGELRNALDDSEKQVRDIEKQRADLRRLLDEANQKYDKLQKEFKVLQTKQTRLQDVSSRSSADSGRLPSPVGNGVAAPAGKMDYVYLKTVLLQFLELKDKKRQADLVKTVLGQLLHMDKKDQDKWLVAISAK